MIDLSLVFRICIDKFIWIGSWPCMINYDYNPKTDLISLKNDSVVIVLATFNHIAIILYCAGTNFSSVLRVEEIVGCTLFKLFPSWYFTRSMVIFSLFFLILTSFMPSSETWKALCIISLMTLVKQNFLVLRR